MSQVVTPKGGIRNIHRFVHRSSTEVDGIFVVYFDDGQDGFAVWKENPRLVAVLELLGIEHDYGGFIAYPVISLEELIALMDTPLFEYNAAVRRKNATKKQFKQ